MIVNDLWSYLARPNDHEAATVFIIIIKSRSARRRRWVSAKDLASAFQQTTNLGCRLVALQGAPTATKGLHTAETLHRETSCAAMSALDVLEHGQRKTDAVRARVVCRAMAG